MDETLRLVPALVAAFGPAGAVSLLLLVVVGHFYRRDFIRRHEAMKDRRAEMEAAHERRDAREERFIVALERLGGSLASHHEQEMEALGRLEAQGRAFDGKVDHSVRTAVGAAIEQVLRHDREQRGRP